MTEENMGATPDKIEDSFQATEDVDANLDAEYDRIQAGEPRPKESEDTPNEEPISTKEEESAQADDKKDKPDETDDKTAKTGDDQTDDSETKGEDEPAVATAPDSWTTDAKAKFKDIDPLIQKEIAKREQDFQNGHAKSEDARQLAKEFKETVSPYEAIITSEGGTPMRAFKDLLNMGYVLRRGTAEQKTQLILDTAKRFNVDLGTVKDGDEDEYTDPQIAELRSEISSLKSQNQNQQAQDQQIRSDEASRVINEFRDAKDDKGDLINPHYESVRETMGVLISSGRATTIKDAYEQSIWSNPEVRKELLISERKVIDRAKLEETKKKATTAKKTAGTQVSTDQANVTPDQKSWDEALNDKFDEIASR